MVWDLTGHLRLAMDLYAAAESAGEDYDPSVYQRQSLSDEPPHLIHTWTALIALLREALERAVVAEPRLAAALIECWLHKPYPVFRRLALFGISRTGEAAAASYLQTLLVDEKRLLWPYYTREFAPRIVADACRSLTAAEVEQVVAKLTGGPPRSMFKGDVSDEDYMRLSDALLALSTNDWTRIRTRTEAVRDAISGMAQGSHLNEPSNGAALRAGGVAL
jgi:hypothetical protein